MNDEQGQTREDYAARLKQVFQHAHRTLAPGMTRRQYFNALQEYRKRYEGTALPTHHGQRIFSAEEASLLSDNSAVYEEFNYSYEGLDRVREMIDAGTPVALLTWHPGAVRHNDYALARVLPEIAIFTRVTFQYGKVVSYPLESASLLSLVRINRFLRESRPVMYYIDGAEQGESVELPLLGLPTRLSIGPIRLMRSIPDIRLVPVSNYYRDGNTVHTIFHSPPPGIEASSNMTDRDVLAALLACLENALREHAPEQVLLTLQVNRESIARRIASA